MKKIVFVLFLSIFVTLALVTVSYSEYQIIQLTNNSYGDYAPQINDHGYVAWLVDTDFQIFLYDGTSIKQIGNNSYFLSRPRINNDKGIKGQVYFLVIMIGI